LQKSASVSSFQFALFSYRIRTSV